MEGKDSLERKSPIKAPLKEEPIFGDVLIPLIIVSMLEPHFLSIALSQFAIYPSIHLLSSLFDRKADPRSTY